MMKKIFGKCFMVAALVAAVGTVSSCKDYNDEMNTENRIQDANLKKQIEELLAKHNADIDAAKDERDRIEGELDQHIADAEAKYATKAELEAAKAELVAADAALKAELEAVKADFAAADASLKAELQNQINGLQTQINDIQNKLDGVNTQLGDLNTKIDQVKSDLEAKIAALTECKCNLKELEEGVAKIKGLEERIIALESKNHLTAEDVKQLIKDFSEVCSCDPNLPIKVEGLNNDLITTTGNLSNLREQVERDSIYLVTVVAQYDTVIKVIQQTQIIKHDSLVADIEGLRDDLKAEIATIENNMENLYNLIVTNLELANGYTDDAIAELKNYVVPAIGGLEGLLNQVRVDVEALKPLQDIVTKLQSQVAANTEAINTLTGRVGQLEEDVDNLEDALEQRISSVNIQGAYSPVIGYFNIPMGIKSNIIAAYYGEFATGETEINFPFVYSSSMLDGSLNALNDLQASLGYAGETIDALNDGKAGKIYLTINPTEVNLDEVEFALVNSLGENAPVELTVQPSEDKLSFGYTRAGGAALYEAVATITDTEATDLSLNVSDYKEVFRDLKNGDDIDLSLIAEALYGTFNEIADANAVSAAWTDVMGHSHTVLSNYDIAALSVQPLSFAFMKDVTVETVPGYEKAKELIAEMIDRLNADMDGHKFDRVERGLYKYLDKVNNYLSGVLSSVNAKLQPVLLSYADKNFALLGQSETRPVEVANELTLVPTTYSGELLAPAYKKYVAITAVNGSTDNLDAVNAAAGEDLNKVLDGDVREITFKGESGNTYEITYSALDYAGFVVNTKYYVTVK